jgi:hypothetical protein
MAEDRVVAFPPDWEDDVPGIRARETMVDARRWAIVAYDPGARREEWYRDGHWGSSSTGRSSTSSTTAASGSGPARAKPSFLTAGRGHRGRNLASGETRLFLIDDPE